MVSQVQVVSILMIIHGALISLMGLLFAALGPFLFAMESSTARRRDDTGLAVMMIIFLIGGLLLLTVGVLHIIAGVRCLKFRGRVLAMVALFANIVALPTGYCSLFAIGMAVYGLIVLFDKDVALAFERGEEGMAREDILAEFAPRYHRRRRPRRDEDDYDRDEDRRPSYPRDDADREDRGEPDDQDRHRFR